MVRVSVFDAGELYPFVSIEKADLVIYLNIEIVVLVIKIRSADAQTVNRCLVFVYESSGIGLITQKIIVIHNVQDLIFVEGKASGRAVAAEGIQPLVRCVSYYNVASVRQQDLGIIIESGNVKSVGVNDLPFIRKLYFFDLFGRQIDRVHMMLIRDEEGVDAWYILGMREYR